MEITNFDKNGNKVDLPNSTYKNSNNPTIINNSRLNNIPVVRLTNPQEKELQKNDFNPIDNQETKLQTEVKKEKSKYEVDKNTTFTIEFGVLFGDGQIIIIPKEKFENVDNIGENLYEKHWVKFRMWNFLESVSWRQECMDFLQTYRIFNLNINKFNELKVRRLLVDWSFKDYGDNHRLFHVNEQLTDESMNLFFKDFNPIIIQHIVNKMNDFLGD